MFCHDCSLEYLFFVTRLSNVEMLRLSNEKTT